jgi:hypothetical protein
MKIQMFDRVHVEEENSHIQESNNPEEELRPVYQFMRGIDRRCYQQNNRKTCDE